MKNVFNSFTNCRLGFAHKGFFMCMLIVFVGNIGCLAQQKYLEEGEDGYPYYYIRSEDGKTVSVENLDGKVVIPLSEGFESIRYDDGFYIARYGSNENSQYCCYTFEGALVIEKGRYDDINVFFAEKDNYPHEKKWYFQVKKNGKVGACDLTGKEIVAPLYEKLIYSFYGGKETFKTPDPTDKYHYIDLNTSIPDIKKPTPVIKQSAEFGKIWIDQIYEKNICYSDIYADLTIYGMKNWKALIQMRIRDSKGKWVKMEYAKEDKDGSYYFEREFVPEYYGTVYSNMMWFLNSNEGLKLKDKKQYELILTIISTKNGETLAVSSPYSFIASPRKDPAAKSTYTPRTYTPVQSPVYQSSSSSRKPTTQNNGTFRNTTTNNSSQKTSTSGSYQNSSEKKSTKKTCNYCKGKKTVSCHMCKGTGRDECRSCHRSGWVHDFRSTDKNAKLKCTKCEGRGYNICNKCNGSGSLRCSVCKGKGEL